mgnify:CR=1 FL=1
MKNPSIYFGFVVVSEKENGEKQVASEDCIAWHALDSAQVAVLQDLMASEFGPKFDALKQELRERAVDLGYASAVSTGLIDDQTVAEVRSKVSGRGKNG